MGRAGPRLSRLARVRHHPRRAAATGRPAPRTARPANQTPPTGFATPYPNRHNTNRFRRDRITSPTSGTYIRPHLHRYWDATIARLSFVKCLGAGFGADFGPGYWSEATVSVFGQFVRGSGNRSNLCLRPVRVVGGCGESGLGLEVVEAFLQCSDRRGQGLGAQDDTQGCGADVDAVDDGGGHSGGVTGRGGTLGRVEHGFEAAGRRPGVGADRGGDLGAAGAEFGPRTAGFDDGDPYPKWGDLLCDGLGESFDPPFGGVVERVAGERDLASIAGQLDDATAPRGPHVGKHGADELDGADEVGGDDRVDLLIGEFLGCPEHPIAGVGDRDVDPPEPCDGAVNGGADRGGVADVEDFTVEGVGVSGGEVGGALGLADGADDGVAAVEELFGEVAAEAAADAGDH